MIAPAVKSNGSVQTVFDFSAFVAPPTTPNRRPSKIRWNVVTNQPKSEHSQSTQTQTRKRKRSIQKNAMSQSLATNDFNNNTISTRSFGPITYTTYQSHGEQKICHEEDITPVDVHTLILGTHPGIQSLEKGEYYGHPMNAFWWIAGDCLGFRRDTGISKRTGKPYKFISHLRHGSNNGPDQSSSVPSSLLLFPSYQDQLRILTSHGFALWDIVQSCERPPHSSLDSDISMDQPNDIPQFCYQHRKSLKRIVLANGHSGYTFLKKHFRSQVNSGQWKVVATTTAKDDDKGSNGHQYQPSQSSSLDVIVALAVSPAAAKYTYDEKRDFWEKYVYQPGLNDYQKNKS